MCGIVGIQLRNPAWDERLGELLTPMLVAMAGRGPDSAGIALYEADLPDGTHRWSLRAPGAGYDWRALADRVADHVGAAVEVRPAADDAVFVTGGDVAAIRKSLEEWAPEVGVVAYGHALEVFKDVGDPAAICARYGTAARRGYQGLGHTRMATESAVTTAHSHPFAGGPDLCLVHNGSFSNYATIRRRLAAAGITFVTDNDSEVAARFLAHRIDAGAGLEAALGELMDTLDGFYTLLVATEHEFAVVRDAFACKPAVIAQTEDYVAMASEYHALATLPGIEAADVFEPMPREVHVWSR